MKKLLIAAVLILAANQLKSEDRTKEIFLSFTKKINSNFEINVLNNAEKINISKTEKSISQSLNYLPSVILRENTGNLGLSLVSVRGFGSNQLTLVYDGIKLPKDITSTYDLSILPVTGVESIYVLSGGWSGVFGSNAEGGVISLKTQDIDKNTQFVEMSSDYGSYDSKRYILKTGVSKDNLSVLTSVENYSSDGFQHNSDANRNSFVSKIAYDFNNFGKTTLNIFAVKLKRGLPSGTPFDIKQFNGKRERTANKNSDWQYDENLFGSIKHEFEISSIKNEISYSRNNLLRKAYQFGSLTSINTYSDNVLIQSYIKGFNLGFEYEKNHLVSPNYGNHNIKNAGYFINRNIDIAERFNTSVYLRYDDNKNYKNIFSPKVVMNYSINNNTGINYSVSRSWRAPNFADVYGSLYYSYDPNPDIKPEKSISNEAGFYYRGFVDLNITGYYYDIDDKITISFDPNTGHSKSVNLGKGYTKGAEINLGYSIDEFKFNAGANIIDVKGKNKGDSEYKKLAYSPDYKLVFSVGYEKNNFAALFKTIRVGEQFSGIDKTGKKIPAYTLSSVSLSKKIKDIYLQLSVENIFNERYATTADIFNGYYPGDPRKYSFSVSAKF